MPPTESKMNILDKAKEELREIEAAIKSVDNELDVVRNITGKPGIDKLLSRSSWLATQARLLKITIANPDPISP